MLKPSTMRPAASGHAGAAALAAAACCLLGLPLLARADAIVTVVQKDRAFDMRELRTAAGTSIRFTNEDDFPHQISVSGPGLEVESPLQAPGEVATVAIPAAGMFKVRCGIHPKMRLTVTAY